jgi:hypothetical protein
MLQVPLTGPDAAAPPADEPLVGDGQNHDHEQRDKTTA